MVLTLLRSGGLLGSPRPPVILDTTSLAGPSKQRVESLVEATRFFELPATITTPSPQPDRFQYHLEIRDTKNRVGTVTFTEEAAPESLNQLARTIQELARSG